MHAEANSTRSYSWQVDDWTRYDRSKSKRKCQS